MDAGPSHKRMNVVFRMQMNDAGDFCPSYLFFKEVEFHEQEFGYSKHSGS